MTRAASQPVRLQTSAPASMIDGLISEAQKEFAKLFVKFMGDGDNKALFEHIDRQGFGELDRCMSLYFLLAVLTTQKARSATVFARLALAIVASNVHAALLVGVLTKAVDNLWSVHFQDVASAQKTAIDKAVAKQTNSLPWARREFVDALLIYLRSPKAPISNLTKLVLAMKPAERQDALRLYLELSQAHEKTAGERSLNVFFLIAHYALSSGHTEFAVEFEHALADTGSILYARCEADRARKAALLEQIAKIKADELPPPGTRPGETKLPPLTKLQTKFVEVYRAYVERGETHLKPFQDFLVTPSGDMLAGCVGVFLVDSAQRYPGPPSREMSMVFVGTLSGAVGKSSSFYAIKVKSYIDAKDGLWSERFAALNVLQYGQPLRETIDKKIADAHFLDHLKAAFWLERKRDATLAELRSYDPINPRSISEPLDGALSDLGVAVGARSLEMLDKAFSAVGKAISKQPDALARWVLVRRILESKVVLTFRHLAYLQGVGLIYMACSRVANLKYKDGFNQEEKTFFYDIDSGPDPYFRDFAVQIEGTIAKRGGRAPRLPDQVRADPAADDINDDAYTLLARAEGSLILCGDLMDLRLTPPIIAAALRGGVEKGWIDKRAELEAIRIPVDGGDWAGKDKLKIGQTLGNIYILWWDGKTTYLHVEGYEQVVFEADYPRLCKIFADYSFAGRLAEGTKDLGVLIPFMFQIIGYIPDLVSGGITGLIKSVLFNLAFEHTMERLGIDPTKAQLVMLGMTLLHAGMQPKASEPHLSTTPEPAVPPPRGPGTDVPVDMYNLDAGTVFTPDAPEFRLQLYETELVGQRSTVPVEPTGLSSNEGYDPRGLHLPDGRVAVGMHEGAAVGENASYATTLAEQRKTGPLATATDNDGAVTYLNDSNRSTSEAQAGRQRQQQQGLQQQQTRRPAANPPERAPGGIEKLERGTSEWEADRAALDAESKEVSVTRANNRRVAFAKDRLRGGKPGEAYLTGRLVETETGRAQMSILGDKATYDASRRNGYQVYVYENEHGQAVYVGLSGRTLESGSGRTRLSDWETRLTSDHVESLWIQNAKRVRVVSDLTYEQMNLLEEQLIKENFGKSYNFNEIANPEAYRIVREGIPEMAIPTNARESRFAVVISVIP